MLRRAFPEIITSLPEAEIEFKGDRGWIAKDGIRGWIAQGSDHQIVFFEIEPSVEVSEHSHDAAWGIVVEGELELTINGNTKIYSKGDEYFIPTEAIHSARFLTKCRVIDFLSDKSRYRSKLVH